MSSLQISLPAPHNHHHHNTPPTPSTPFPNLIFSHTKPRHFLPNSFSCTCSKPDTSISNEFEEAYQTANDTDEFSGVEIEIEKVSRNCRRIKSKVVMYASLEFVWKILTDYERLADFIPGLAVSKLVEKRPNFARLFQIGQQNLAFGLKFNAEGVVDCYEKDLEVLPFGQRRDIDFKMVEGDFQVFEGKWSIEQYSTCRSEQRDSLVNQEFQTSLTYIVDVKPKMWLPIQLVEGRLCREIKLNLSCIREEAEKAFQSSLLDH